MTLEQPKVVHQEHQIKKSMMKIGKRYLEKRKRIKKVNEFFSSI